MRGSALWLWAEADIQVIFFGKSWRSGRTKIAERSAFHKSNTVTLATA
jgi:hypothetical protein